jgi:hypothetical protein
VKNEKKQRALSNENMDSSTYNAVFENGAADQALTAAVI